jgi:hypothetical protein
MKYRFLALSVFLVLGIFGSSLAVPPDQPNMTAARAALQAARSELNVAEHNKGGHRAKAVQYVNSAIAEVNKGIAFDRSHNHAQPSSINNLFSFTASPDQPHMRAALDRLNEAKESLQKATPDKGGHRANAIDLVNKAIDEVNQGIAAGA